MERTATPYSAKDITLSLNIGDSTLRKWCLSLEEHGYTFYRTDQNKRLFTEKDIIVLRHFQQLVKEKNMSMNNAALIVTSKFQKGPFSDETDVEQIENEMNIVPSIRSDDDSMVTTKEQQLKLANELITMREQQLQLVDLAMRMANELQSQRQETESLRKELQETLTEVKKLTEHQNDNRERELRRDSQLAQSLREAQELKKLIREVKEEQEKKPPRKGFLNWLSRGE